MFDVHCNVFTWCGRVAILVNIPVCIWLQVAIKIIDKTHMNAQSLQKVSRIVSRLTLYLGCKTDGACKIYGCSFDGIGLCGC